MEAGLDKMFRLPRKKRSEKRTELIRKTAVGGKVSGSYESAFVPLIHNQRVCFCFALARVLPHLPFPRMETRMNVHTTRNCRRPPGRPDRRHL